MPGGIELVGLSSRAVVALAVGGGATLAALYLLRRRPTRVVVPFAPLWFGSGDPRAERRARALRRWLSLAIQLAIFAALLAAAADPRPATGQPTGRTVVILVDRSASMQARDEPGSRFERARARARAAIDDLGADDRALIASFASDVSALTGIETDRDRLRAAVDGLRVTDEPGDLASALVFCGALLRGRARPALWLISDGAGPDVTGADVTAALTGVDVRLARVGQRGDNLAIVGFSARRLPADPSSVQLALVVQSFRAVAAEVTVGITAGPARIPIAARHLRLAPGARVEVAMTDVPIPDGRLEATLRDARDDLPLDDRAYAVVPGVARLRVLVVGSRNLYLDGALLSLGDAVQVEHVAAGDARAGAVGAVGAARDGRARWGAADVVILDGVTPDPAPTTGRFLYIDPAGRASPWPDRGQVSEPIVTDTRRDHPLVKQLGLSDLNIARARRLALGRDDVAVVSAPSAPLLIARTTEHLRLIALAFDVRRSDLPMRGAFPLLLANALSWLAARPSGEGQSWPTGRTVRVELAGAGIDAGGGASPDLVDVLSPDGTVVRTPVDGGALTLFLGRAGFTQVTRARGGLVAQVAANLASPIESDIRPRSELTIATRTPPPPDPTRAPVPRRAPWLLAVLAALALVAGEWIAYHRRITV